MRATVDALNSLWTAERALIDQLVARATVTAGRGHGEVAGALRGFAIEQMMGVASLLERIVAIGGTPEVQAIGPVELGAEPRRQMQLSLEAESLALARAEAALAACGDEDEATGDVLRGFVQRHRTHVEWLTGRLGDGAPHHDAAR